MVLDLTGDGGNGEAGEIGAFLRIEAVDRLDQRDRADLHEVLEPLAPVGVPPCEHAYEREMELDQSFPGGAISGLAVDLQKVRRELAATRGRYAIQSCHHSVSPPIDREAHNVILFTGRCKSGNRRLTLDRVGYLLM